jgi:FkbM family methyltransferase
MSYSQNNEENLIRQFFKGQTGRFIDIGANDGKTLSNTLWCAENGWNGVCVEPSKEAFIRLQKLHENTEVLCMNCGISNESGELVFFESGNHLNKNDIALLSSIKESELNRWVNTPNQFTQTKGDFFTWLDFHRLIGLAPIYDLISIDAEGCDWDILQQIDLTKAGCKMLIIETNGIENQKYIDYCAGYGMRLYAKNYENLIFVK